MRENERENKSVGECELEREKRERENREGEKRERERKERERVKRKRVCEIQQHMGERLASFSSYYDSDGN